MQDFRKNVGIDDIIAIAGVRAGNQFTEEEFSKLSTTYSNILFRIQHVLVACPQKLIQSLG